MNSRKQIEQPEVISGVLGELLDNLYINNVDKRLRELDQPSENDSKRWIWELIQNAKDSIVEDHINQFVDIKLNIKNETVVFKHNGSPFTAKALFGLLYKYSAGDINNIESTGRFGTGFLTTHTLSKIVSIEGDLYKDNDKSELCGFSATMYRDGIDSNELLAGLKKMRASISYTEEKNNWTTFTYHLTNEQNKTALQLGLENFITNITQTMLFCKELNTVELDNNGEVSKIIRKSTQIFENDINISEFEIIGNNSITRKFLHKKSSKKSEELSMRFKTEREVRLMAAIEIDNENNLVENETAPSHFCVLPLVGSEKHIMPIYLNSPDFEPDSERQSLLLDGLIDWEEHQELGTIITVRGINRLILKESVELYDSLVSYICENGYKKLYLLAKGLKRTPDFEKNFNDEWFEKEIILPYRNVLKQYAIVETGIGYQKLFSDDNIPYITIPIGSKDVRQKIYSLALELFPEKLPLEKHFSNWANFAWKECGLFDKEDLCIFVSEQKKISKLPSIEWVNTFLTFIKEEDETLLKKYPLVPNRCGDLISLDNETFAEGVDLSDYMLDTLNNLGIDLRPTLLSKNITSITLPVKIDRKNIAEIINEQIENIINDNNLAVIEIIEKVLPLINNIPTNDCDFNPEFILKQKKLHSLTKTLYLDLQIIENTSNDIPEKAFQTLHKWLINHFIIVVAGFKNLYSLPDNIDNKIEWLNSFIAFVSKEIKEGDLDLHAIIPNQKDIFCFKNDLYIDDNIPEILKSEQAERFELMLKDTLLHKEINSINISNKKDINTVIEMINSIFRNDENLAFAIYLIHLLPENSSTILHNSQKNLIEIVEKYDFVACKSYSKSIITCSNEDLWSKANYVIINNYKTRIREDKTIDGLRTYLSEQNGKIFDHGDTIIFLNNFYDYLTSRKIIIDCDIIPNQKGEFCAFDSLYKDDNIPKELINVLALLNPNEDFRNILAESSLSIIPAHSKTIEDIAKPIDDAIKEAYAVPSNWDNENFKKAVALLIEYFKRYKESSKNNFTYSYNKKDTIELNVLLSEKDREIIQLYLKGELGIEQVKEKDNEIAQLKVENLKLKTKNEELERLLAEKELIEEEKKELEETLNEILNSNPNSNEVEIFLEKIKLKNDEITAIGDTTIAIAYDGDISLNDQKEANREAKEIVKERLENDGFSFTKGIDGYSTVDGVIKDDIEYPLVVKSYRYQGSPLKIGANEWIQLMKPNSMFWVHFGNRNIGCLNLYELLKKQDKLSLSFSTENLDLEDKLENFAEILHYFKNVHFDFDSLKPNSYSTAENLTNYRFTDRRIEADLSEDDDNIL